MSDKRNPSAGRPELTGDTLPFAYDGKVVREIVVTDSGASVGLAPGNKVGDWRIDGKIGEGGMGTVHAATHPMIGKRAAIKVVHAELCRTAGMAERFVQEARAVNQICHPSIVDIFDIGRLPDGRPYLVMELLRGRTVGERMEQGRMSPLEAIEILLQISDALVAAHAHGVVHRDLKPDNIYLSDSAGGAIAVKVVDWGIAKLRDASPRSVTLTTSGVILGTPQYVSPEQARGKSLDERSDIYSLGVIAYEMFLEGPPFVADSVADMVAMHLREPPPPPGDVWPDIPLALERLLLAMLEKDVADRPSLATITATLREVRDVLGLRTGRPPERRLASGSMPPPTTTNPSPVSVVSTSSGGFAALTQPARRPAQRWYLAGGGVVVAALAVLLVVSLGSTKRTRSPAATAPAPIAMPAAATSAPHAPATARPRTAAAAPAALALEVRVSPSDARVWIDDDAASVQQGHAGATLAPGRHAVRVEAPGHEPYRRTIDVHAATVLEIRLSPSSPARRTHRRERPAPTPAPTPPPTTAVDPNGTIEPF